MTVKEPLARIQVPSALLSLELGTKENVGTQVEVGERKEVMGMPGLVLPAFNFSTWEYSETSRYL